jgi:hypothetical protein
VRSGSLNHLTELNYIAVSMRDSITPPVHVQEGEDALLMCVVRGAEGKTVLWKRQEPGSSLTHRILTAGEVRTTADMRFSVLHDSSNKGKLF